LTGLLAFRIVTLRFNETESKGIESRSMRLYYRNFAFTRRFSFTGERAGETRAVKMKN
jgi:hypothetical protein